MVIISGVPIFRIFTVGEWVHFLGWLGGRGGGGGLGGEQLLFYFCHSFILDSTLKGKNLLH